MVVARINYIATATAVLLSLFIHFPNSYVTIYVPGEIVTNYLKFAVQYIRVYVATYMHITVVLVIKK